MNRHLLYVPCFLLAVVAPASAQVEWKDPSPHTAKLVTVEDHVQLEVLRMRSTTSPRC